MPIPVLGKPAYHVVSRLTKECGRAPNFLAASSVAFSYHFLFEALVDITRQHYSHSPVGFVCLASAAVTRSPGDGPQIADFQPFCAISHQVSKTDTAKIRQIRSNTQ